MWATSGLKGLALAVVQRLGVAPAVVRPPPNPSTSAPCLLAPVALGMWACRLRRKSDWTHSTLATVHLMARATLRRIGGSMQTEAMSRLWVCAARPWKRSGIPAQAG